MTSARRSEHDCGERRIRRGAEEDAALGGRDRGACAVGDARASWRLSRPGSIVAIYGWSTPSSPRSTARRSRFKSSRLYESGRGRLLPADQRRTDAEFLDGMIEERLAPSRSSSGGRSTPTMTTLSTTSTEFCR